MSESRERLERDLVVLHEMAGEMDDYLTSDVLFWLMMKGGMPKLTLGGYLMRQHRLLALRDLLDKEMQGTLEAAVSRYSQALVEKVVRLEQKAHMELEARIRQWGEYLKDLSWDRSAAVASYGTAVETRATIQALVGKMREAPYQLDPAILPKIALLDGNLRQHWQPGPFVWPAEWLPAYPIDEFWWLYGGPVPPRG